MSTRTGHNPRLRLMLLPALASTGALLWAWSAYELNLPSFGWLGDPLTGVFAVLFVAMICAWIGYWRLALSCAVLGLLIEIISLMELAVHAGSSLLEGTDGHRAVLAATGLAASVALITLCRRRLRPDGRWFVAFAASFSSYASVMMMLSAATDWTPVGNVQPSVAAGHALTLFGLGAGLMYLAIYTGPLRHHGRLFWLPVGVLLAGGVSTGLLLSWSMHHAAEAFLLALLITGPSSFASILLHRGALSAAAARRWLRAVRREARRKLARQRALEKSEAKYRQLFDNVTAAVMITRPDGTILSANPAMVRLLGFRTEADLLTRDVRSLHVDWALRERISKSLIQSQESDWAGEAQFKTESGDRISLLVTTRLLRDQDGNPDYYLSIYTDITDLREAERAREQMEVRLRLTHKLEAVGRLAAGVAHEINTPIQYISDNVHFLQTAYEDVRSLVSECRKLLYHHPKIEALAAEADLEFLDNKVPESFAHTLEGIGRVAEIVRSMKEFAYPDQKEKILANVNGLIRNTLNVARSEYSRVANVQVDYGNVKPVYCFAGELNQVFLNIIVNAAHAIQKRLGESPEAGLIIVQTSQVGKSVKIMIADNGCGIPAAALAKIFDPFFTTKAVGKGTGQGLAISQSIVVDKHQGTIDVTSEPGSGTRFEICLPEKPQPDARPQDSGQPADND